MLFTAPLLLAAAVSATKVYFDNLKLTSDNEAYCSMCSSVHGDLQALRFCLAFVSPECTYIVDATLTGKADPCPSGYGIDLGDITGGLEGLEVTSMQGSLDLTLTDGTKGTCNLKGSASNDSTQQCSANPIGQNITATLTDGTGTLSLDKINGRYISFKADPADACGTNIVFAKFPEPGANATLTAHGLGGLLGPDGVAPVFGTSLVVGLLGALHMV